MSRRHVDIGLPVYQGARYLGATLESLLGQTHQDLTIWISDNGSTDDTERISRCYAERDDRVRYERHPENRGAAWNFEHVRVFAHGPYFKWAAHDDLHEPTYLARCLEVLEADPGVIIAQPRTVFVDDVGDEMLRSFRVNDWSDPSPAVRLRTVLGRNHEFSFPYGLLRTEVLSRLGPHRARYGADVLMLAELALLGRFVEIDEHLFLNRLHPNRSMVTNSGLRYRLSWNQFWGGEGRGSRFPTWRFLADLREVVDGADLDDDERRGCHQVLIGWARDNWTRLGVDVPLGLELLARAARRS